MVRRDHVYWERLRKDRRSNAAVLLTALAALIAAIMVTTATIPGSQYEARSNPLYWLILLPVAWWVSELAGFERWAVRSWSFVLALLAAVGIACLALALSAKTEATLDWVACICLEVIICASLLVRRNSLVALEGPAR